MIMLPIRGDAHSVDFIRTGAIADSLVETATDWIGSKQPNQRIPSCMFCQHPTLLINDLAHPRVRCAFIGDVQALSAHLMGFSAYGHWCSYKRPWRLSRRRIGEHYLLPEDAWWGNQFRQHEYGAPAHSIHRDGVHRRSWLAKHRSVSG